MNHHLLKGIAAAALFGAAVMPSAASADDTAVATGTISAGALTLTTVAAPSFSATLDGTDKSPTYDLPFTVKDVTGTGGGWNATITSSQFSAGGGHTLPAGASAVTAMASECAAGTCTDPVNDVGYPLSVPTDAPAVKLFKADVGSGMGEFTVTPTVTVNVPANTFAGTYTSTITLGIVSGP